MRHDTPLCFIMWTEPIRLLHCRCETNDETAFNEPMITRSFMWGWLSEDALVVVSPESTRASRLMYIPGYLPPDSNSNNSNMHVSISVYKRITFRSYYSTWNQTRPPVQTVSSHITSKANFWNRSSHSSALYKVFAGRSFAFWLLKCLKCLTNI